MAELELFHYWRSSASWRVRAALAFKKIPYRAIHTGLLNGDNTKPEYLALNPAGAVPTLKTEQGVLTESLAIIRYLDEIKPEPPLLPQTPFERAKVWALAETINSATHPLQNLHVIHYAASDPVGQKKWAQHWIANGLDSYEALLTGNSPYSFGNTLTLADLCLIPQCYNALRYEVDLTAFPRIKRIYEHGLGLDAFKESHPDQFKPID